MSKNLNYSYYGVETTVWPSNGDNVASMVGRNTWYYYDGGYDSDSPNAPHWGKPYDPSVAIWRLEKQAPYANKGYVCILPGDNLNVDVKLAETDSTVPLIMQATTGAGSGPFPSTEVSMDWATGGRIDKRLAYDTSWDNNSLWSRLCYDINPQMFCLFPAIQCYNKSNNSVSGYALAAYTGVGRLKTYIDADPDNRDVTMIRYDMYYGGNDSARITTGQFITQSVDRPTDNQKPCVPLCEPYCDCPLPDYQPIKDAVQEKTEDDEGHPDWESSKIFNPFIMSPRRFWYDSSVYIAYNNFYTIGFNLSRTRNEYRSGYQIVRDKEGWPIGDARITAQWIRGNFSRKDFDDVSYHWRWYIWDTVNKVELPNGFNLNNLSSNISIRVMTELVIDDAKGQSKGEALERAVKHETAYTGFWFADTPTHCASGTLNETGDGVGIFLPKRVNGIPNGEYYTGEEIADAPEAKETSTDDWYNGGDINPVTGDEGDWSNQQHLRIGPDRSGGATYWALDLDEFKEFIKVVNKSIPKLNKPRREDYDTDQEYEDALDKYYKEVQAYADETLIQWGGTNAWEYVVTSKWYPMNVDYSLNINNDTIHISQVDTEIEADYLHLKTKLWNMGDFYIEERYKNWRDYKCQITLMLPFIGTLALDPQLYMGHTLSVKYALDWVTASCTAYIYRDGVMMDSADGTFGMDLPLSLASAGSYQALIGEGMLAKKQARREVGNRILDTLAFTFAGEAASYGGVDTGAMMRRGVGISAIVGSVRNLRNLTETVAYKIEHTPLHFGEVGAASPINSFIQDWRTRLIITYPSIDYTHFVSEEDYAHTQGYACCMQLPSLLENQKFDCHGYTVVGAIDLTTVDCTDTEADMIRKQLQAGVYINV